MYGPCILYYTSQTMEYLPFDIKETIAASLSGTDLASMVNVDPEFQSFFYRRVAPTFLSEFIRISKIYKYLERIFSMKVASHDIMGDGGDGHIMSHILGREVGHDEEFQNNTDYAVWQTMSVNIDREPSMAELFDTFKYHTDGFNFVFRPHNATAV